ncbi:mannose-binding protein C [Elysia marginata]|uniref:Mannose-binding protein C n=1 Tax=Elysia marginata TaxID=1093978 RepID=A0AAV4GYU9_9GAST|nr:mannose-binding protein C [Elysia marginata]
MIPHPVIPIHRVKNRPFLKSLFPLYFPLPVLLSAAVQHVTYTWGTIVLRSFKKSSSTQLGTSQLASPWTSLSLSACVARCLAEYSTSCFSVIYHVNLQLCTPGSMVSFGLPLPDVATEGVLYYPDCGNTTGFTLELGYGTQACVKYSTSCFSVIYHVDLQLCTPGSMVSFGLPLPDVATEGILYYPDCGNTTGFTLELGYGTQACVKLLDSKNFDKQRAECASLGGYLASARTIEKLQLLQDFAEGKIASMGLDDQVTEGIFIWHDTGQPLTSEEEGVLFPSFEPNNSGGNEDCVVCNFPDLMNDVPCHSHYPAICERPWE